VTRRRAPSLAAVTVVPAAPTRVRAGPLSALRCPLVAVGHILPSAFTCCRHIGAGGTHPTRSAKNAALAALWRKPDSRTGGLHCPPTACPEAERVGRDAAPSAFTCCRHSGAKRHPPATRAGPPVRSPLSASGCGASLPSAFTCCRHSGAAVPTRRAPQKTLRLRLRGESLTRVRAGPLSAHCLPRGGARRT
jgi:hypothetical protein